MLRPVTHRGIVAAAYSMDARLSPFVVNPDDIFRTVTEKLRDNTVEVLSSSQRLQVTPHVAAQRMAETRVAEAMRLRGQTRTTRVHVDVA